MQATQPVSMTPYLAPLSQPMMLHALRAQEERTLPTPATALEDHLSRAVQEFAASWSLLFARVKEQRYHVYEIMTPAIEQSLLTSEWIAEKLAELSPRKGAQPLSPETLSRWREQGLLVYEEKNHPNSDSAAALLLLRLLIQNKERRWTPRTPKGEPVWWCWRQDTPQSPIIPCSVQPFPADLPHHALLWTPWLGAAWHPSWLQLGTLGCARWAGTIREKDALRWDMREEDLRMRDQEIVPLGENLLDTVVHLTRHTLATLALLRLATPRLEQATIFPFPLA